MTAAQNPVPRVRQYDPAVQEAFAAWQEIARRSKDASGRCDQAEAQADVLREQAWRAFEHYQDLLQGGTA